MESLKNNKVSGFAAFMLSAMMFLLPTRAEAQIDNLFKSAVGALEKVVPTSPWNKNKYTVNKSETVTLIGPEAVGPGAKVKEKFANYNGMDIAVKIVRSGSDKKVYYAFADGDILGYVFVEDGISSMSILRLIKKLAKGEINLNEFYEKVLMMGSSVRYALYSGEEEYSNTYSLDGQNKSRIMAFINKIKEFCKKAK